MSFIRSVIRCVRLSSLANDRMYLCKRSTHMSMLPMHYTLHTLNGLYYYLFYVVVVFFLFFSLIFFGLSPYFVSAGGRHQLTNILLCASRIVFSYFVRCFLSLPFLRASAILLFSHRCRCSLVSWRSFVCWLFFSCSILFVFMCCVFPLVIVVRFMCLPSSIHLLSCVYMSLCFVHTVHTVCMLYTLGIHCLSVRCNAFW